MAIGEISTFQELRAHTDTRGATRSAARVDRKAIEAEIDAMDFEQALLFLAREVIYGEPPVADEEKSAGRIDAALSRKA